MTTRIKISNEDEGKTVTVDVMSDYSSEKDGEFVSIRTIPISPKSEIVEYVHSHQYLSIKEEK